MLKKLVLFFRRRFGTSATVPPQSSSAAATQSTARTSELQGATVLMTTVGGEAVPEATSTFLEADFAERYENICNFAEGGVGCISKARDRAFDRIVAVKSLREEYRKNSTVIAGFIEECRLNARLDHPAIVPVYALGRDHENNPAVAMKLINGSSLRQFLQKLRETYQGKKVHAAQEHPALLSRLEYFLKICEVVEYCHARKVVHGDLKPDNILLGPHGELYVMDWGCAKPTGSVMLSLSGTPNYMPPEFFKTKIVSEGTDIYALGMILFELVTLRRGSNGRTAEDASNYCNVNRSADYTHIHARIKVNERIRAVIQKAVQPDPGKRYDTVHALAADVRRFIFDEEVLAAPDNWLRKFFRFTYRHRMGTLISVLLLMLLCGGGVSHAYYQKARMAHEQDIALMRRLRMQSVTDDLGFQVERRILHAHAEVLVLADNLFDALLEQNAPDEWQAFGKAAWKITHFERNLPHAKIGSATQPGIAQVVFHSAKKRGSFQSSEPIPPTVHFDNLPPDRISWSSPYRNSQGEYRVLCMYPLLTPQLVIPALEMRLEIMLEPLLALNRNDHHELYLINTVGDVISVGPQGVLILGESDAPYGFKRDRLIRIAKQLRQQNMQQLELLGNGLTYVASGTWLPSIDAVLLQVMDTGRLAAHEHQDSEPIGE